MENEITEKQVEYTQGRWDFHVLDGRMTFVQSNGEDICEVMNTSANILFDKAEANAKLIAAAPELLEVAKYAYAMLHQDRDSQFFPLVNDLRKAIEKATK